MCVLSFSLEDDDDDDDDDDARAGSKKERVYYAAKIRKKREKREKKREKQDFIGQKNLGKNLLLFFLSELLQRERESERPRK